MIINSPLLWLGMVGLAFAAVLYFIFLPHIEGSSFKEPQVDQREWLVKCPNCQRWRLRQPIATNSEESQNNLINQSDFTNWYRCFQCEHRWEETYKQ